MRSALDRILELQHEDLWRERKTPEEEDGLLCSQIPMDIWTVPPRSRMTHMQFLWMCLGPECRNTIITMSARL